MNETWVLHPLNLQHNETRPLSRRDVEEHVLVKEVPFRSTCASVDTQLLSSWIEQANNMSSIASSTTSTPVKKTINLMLVSDYLRYQLLGSWTELSLLEMMNYFNVLYQTAGPLFSATSMSLSFQLVGVYTATSSSWLNASSSSPIDADTLLTSFCRWQSSPQILTLLRYDSIHLFTAQTVTSSQTSGKIQGYSSVGSICDTFRHCGFISSGLTPMLATQAHVLLHEIGHQLGASHDGVGNTCAVNGFIMESNACEGCGNLSSTWSECSVKAISSFFNSHDTTCLDDTPSLCGNGILDAGEQCDSGTSLGSACCYGNCTLKPPAQCDDQNGNCCLQCQFLAKNTTCRRQVSGDARQSCDVEDACSGTSAFCENQVKPNGTNCFTDPSQPQWLDGFCNRGTCESRFQVCQKLGYAYNEQCENPSSPCVLICWSTSSMSCLKFSYPSTPPKLYFVPDFSNCTINNKSGYCMVGQCVPSKGMARFLPFQWTLQIGVIFVFILIFS
ncbi:hypothetical protein HMI54_007606 [Coelomomyces lativittatus]|nr:hypothetical protein HMI55_003112 [Coelomomyces lativittatus]KAJ1516944.1 hypothetical protein HMI54_007606 [Coelomomyces lativittatus]